MANGHAPNIFNGVPNVDVSRDSLLTVLHLNVRSLSRKTDQIELFSEEFQPHFMLFSEHWATQDMLDHTYTQGYEKVSSFCRSTHQHGGVVIYAKYEIADMCGEIQFPDGLSAELHFECSGVTFHRHLCIIVIYRSPDGDFNTFITLFTELLIIITSRYKHVIMCGDLNVDWLVKNTRRKILADLLESFGMLSLIREPTRTARNGHSVSATAIDYVITNKPESVVGCTVFDPGISDHTSQILQFYQDNTFRNTTYSFTTRRITEGSLYEFLTLFRRNTVNFSGGEDVDVLFTLFWSHFKYCFDIAFPETSVKRHNKASYLFPFPKHIKEKNRLLKEINTIRKLHRSDLLDKIYLNYKHSIQLETEKARKKFFSEKIQQSESKTKTLWKIVNEKSGRVKAKRELSVEVDGVVYTNPRQVADLFGYHFSTAVPQLLQKSSTTDGSVLSCTLSKFNSKTFSFLPVSYENVHDIICKLKNKNSTGIDDVPVKVIKYCSVEISSYLAHIINTSVAQGKFPTALKINKCIPIFKKGEKGNVDNYRSIVCVTPFSKIIETAMHNQVMQFCNKFDLITNHQYGFRKGHSTENAAEELLEFVNNGVDGHNAVIGIFFDLSRAFDTVDPKILSDKLHALGIRGTVNDWFVSYVTGRKIAVRVENSYSEKYDILLGTPQGGILGPLIFILYINDLPEYITHGKVYMYADDTSIVVTDPDPASLNNKVNCVMEEFNQWCLYNNLILNKDKTTIVKFAYGNPAAFPYRVTLGNAGFPFRPSTVFLGIHLDCHLRFSDHIDSVCSKINKAYYVMSSLNRCLQPCALLDVYYAMVYSVMSFNIIHWGQAVEWHRVFVCQKRVVRLMFGIEQRVSCRSVFVSNKVLTFVGLYLYKLLCFIYNHKKDFLTQIDIHCHDTRGKDNLNIPRFNHSKFKLTPQYVGISVYNDLPERFKHITTLKTFKKEIKGLLLEGCPYTVTEFKNQLREKRCSKMEFLVPPMTLQNVNVY